MSYSIDLMVVVNLVSSSSEDRELLEIKRKLRPRAFRALRDMLELGKLLRILEAQGFSLEEILDPEKLWLAVYDPRALELLSRLRATISAALPALVYYLLTLRHYSPAEDQEFLRRFYSLYVASSRFAAGFHYLLRLLGSDHPWIRGDPALHRIYETWARSEIPKLKDVLRELGELDLGSEPEDPEARIIEELNFTFFEESIFWSISHPRVALVVLRPIATRELKLIRILGQRVEQLLENPSDTEARAIVELIFEPAMYATIYYLLAQELGSDRLFVRRFLELYLRDRDFRRGVKFVVRVMLIKGSVARHPLVRTLSRTTRLMQRLKKIFDEA